MNIKPALLLPALLLLAGCAGMKVDSQQIGSYNFSPVENIQWADAPADILDDDDTFLNNDMRLALDEALAARGWRTVATGGNLTATYYIKLKEQQEYTTPAREDERQFTGGLTFNKDGKWNYEERQPDRIVYNVEIGTLHLTLTDPATGNAVWTGTLQTKLDRSKPIEKQKELYRAVAAKITARIPR